MHMIYTLNKISKYESQLRIKCHAFLKLDECEQPAVGYAGSSALRNSTCDARCPKRVS
jgi:hypothetical protein